MMTQKCANLRQEEQLGSYFLNKQEVEGMAYGRCQIHMLVEQNWCQRESSCYCKFNWIWQLKKLSRISVVCIMITGRLGSAIYM